MVISEPHELVLKLYPLPVDVLTRDSYDLSFILNLPSYIGVSIR